MGIYIYILLEIDGYGVTFFTSYAQAGAKQQQPTNTYKYTTSIFWGTSQQEHNFHNYPLVIKFSSMTFLLVSLHLVRGCPRDFADFAKGVDPAPRRSMGPWLDKRFTLI